MKPCKTSQAIADLAERNRALAAKGFPPQETAALREEIGVAFQGMVMKFQSMEAALALAESRMKSWSVRPGESLTHVSDTIQDALAFDPLA